MEMNKLSLSENIKNLADSIGIDTIGFVRADEFKDYALDHPQRKDPKLSLASAKSIIVVGIYIGGITLPEWENEQYGRTSRLYLSGFFLDIVKPIEPIAALLKNQGYRAKICDGSAKEGSILPLKLAAIRAGLGWQGKHSLLISKKYGTFLALGGIVTDADLEYNTTIEPNRCHKCNECQKACPVDALAMPYVLSVEQCMSNLLAGEKLPERVMKAMDNRIGDCEICQQACPWNRRHLKKPLSTKMTLSFRKRINDWKDVFFLPHLSRLSENEYKSLSSQLNTDIPYHIFQRNVRIAMKGYK